ncbi:hypothetical protein FRC11_002540 [Ceratobasidium sp. 423]|nr:hypothetical protein FRC11_002540 [Ceratobasidium sp. 423]
MQHLFEQILAKGTADNFSTKTIEHMHMDTLKDTFPATNKKDWEKQMIQWLTHCEKILEFLLFQTWRKSLESQSQVDDLLELTMVQHLDDPHSQVDAPMSTNPADRYKHQYQRGGYALQPPTPPAHSPSLAVQRLPPPTLPQKVKKRKRQIDNEDISEERTSKRILQSQQNHSLQDFQDISLVPSDTMTIAEVQDKYKLPSLLSDYNTCTS